MQDPSIPPLIETFRCLLAARRRLNGCQIEEGEHDDDGAILASR